MPAIMFENKKSNIPSWEQVYKRYPLSYAYTKDSFCISIFADDRMLYILQPAFVVSEKTTKTLEEWLEEKFDAQNKKQVTNQPGEVILGVWRPGLYFLEETNQALNITDHQRFSAEQSLNILLQKLVEIFEFIEPSTNGLKAFSHKTRELLILACTEVENMWTHFMSLAGKGNGRFTTNDYVKLLAPLHLAEYEVILKPYPTLNMVPFGTWSNSTPTTSLAWYDAYNKTKHNRETNFHLATLEMCTEAVAAAVVMHCVRFGPFNLFQGQGLTSSNFNQIFSIQLKNPDPTSFYVPDFKSGSRSESLTRGSADFEPWRQNSLSI